MKPGTYIRTKEIRAKQSKPKTKAQKIKLRQSVLNSFKNGRKNGMLRRKHKKESIERMSRKGTKHTLESRKKMADSHRGEKSHNYL